MLYANDPRDEEFKSTIKGLERQKFWFPFALLGCLTLLMWTTGGNVFERPNTKAVYPATILIGLIYAVTELLNVKILLIKAEYRDWLRDFKSDRWKDINTD